MTAVHRISPIWLRAALLGSVWASVEIVLGSFLHNIRFPASGTILAALGVCICVAGAQIWKDHGLIWRTGLLCALMKSISPSSVIIGPMVGILMEAFWLDLSARMFGRRVLGYLIGGAIAVCMPLLQKIAVIVFTYGIDAARLYVALYDLAAKALAVRGFGAVDLVTVLLGINVVLGLLAATLGLLAGKRAATTDAQPSFILAGDSPYSLGEPDPSQRFSLSALGLHVMLMPAGFIAIQHLPVWASSVLVLCYFALCLWSYPRIRRRFRHPRLWVEFALVSLLAGFLLGELTDTRQGWSWSGLVVGLQMTLRALLVVTAFSCVSIELRNPVVLQWLLRKGLGQFSAALEVAFQALPGMIRSIGEEKQFLREPLNSIARVLSTARAWLDSRERGMLTDVFIITGERGSGKTTKASAIASALVEKGISVRGVLSPVVCQGGVRVGYDVRDIATGIQVPLCRTDAPDAGIVAGPFKFSPEAFAFGSAALSPPSSDSPQVLVVDEAGPLEVDGKGWAPAVERLLENHVRAMILVARQPLISRFIAKWHLEPVRIWDAGSLDARDAVEELEELVKSHAGRETIHAV